ncbi:response regulator transcription factor [Arcanobacterium phocisimile]|uniref:Response regulator transcription factor n=1 Tax=Arcanobacterium phocisimile TaxID=1302235 RepID=A0ABX7IEP8_9ACTO|nr:response regulator transcription factor [Arcanobacterium phocisimile]QRV01611.1 response regulator transcription factor [Arcanobacterium phocisimile]
MKPRALVVDDEAQMISIVTFALETQDFICESATSPSQAWKLLQNQHYDLVVLDVLMPRGSGIDITRRMRANGIRTPIILLTALGDESDRIAGLEAGADDYVTKPFSPRELALRAQAIVRRFLPQAEQQIVNIGPLRVDLETNRAWYNDILITESHAEVAILGKLARHANDVVPTRDIVNTAWGGGVTSGGREMVKTTIYRLRKHMELAGVDPGCIRSHRGQGYSLDTSNTW